MRDKHQTLSAMRLSKKYGSRMVVRDVDLNVDRGEIVGLLGPNGAGKTTSFYMITGMIKPTKGHVLLDEMDITNDAMYKRARKGIGYLSQEPSIFGKLTVEDNLKLVLEMRKEISKTEQNEKMDIVLNDLSVTHLKKNKGNTLSGGERRRVEIARCLCMDPDFVLLDEPFAGIDPISVGDIQEIIYQLRDKGIGILITDHNYREMLDTCNHSYVLSAGKIIAQGGKDDILANEEVKKVYLGETVGG